VLALFAIAGGVKIFNIPGRSYNGSVRERVAKILPEPFTTAPMCALPIRGVNCSELGKSLASF
jgi:hypothetical protein